MTFCSVNKDTTYKLWNNHSALLDIDTASGRAHLKAFEEAMNLLYVDLRRNKGEPWKHAEWDKRNVKVFEMVYDEGSLMSLMYMIGRCKKEADDGFFSVLCS